MIRVCHMTSVHGAEDVRIFHKECVSLASAGYEVYLVECGKSFEKKGVHIIGVGDIPTNRRKRMLYGTTAVYKAALATNADIYHLHDPELLPYGLKLKRRGKMVIFDSHENTATQILEKEWLPRYLRAVVYLFYNLYQKYVCSRLDAVISPHDFGCEYFKKINKRTVLVTNYPIFSDFTASFEKIPNSICFAGGISELWCHEAIIRALEQLPASRYVLCGRSNPDYVARLAQLPGWSQTDFRGKLPHESVYPMLLSCCVGMSIVKYTRNGGGKRGTMANTKIFEEMMAGLPVVCTDFELWREFVERWHCGICVDPENVDEIADAIRYLLDHPDEARRMGENGRRAVEEEFNWAREEKKLLALYREILRA